MLLPAVSAAAAALLFLALDLTSSSLSCHPVTPLSLGRLPPYGLYRCEAAAAAREEATGRYDDSSDGAAEEAEETERRGLPSSSEGSMKEVMTTAVAGEMTMTVTVTMNTELSCSHSLACTHVLLLQGCVIIHCVTTMTATA